MCSTNRAIKVCSHHVFTPQYLIFEERWKTEHGRAPTGSDDLPFHVRANYREYVDLKRQLARM